MKPIMVDIHSAAELLSISRSTIKKAIINDEFQKGRKVSARRTCYLVTELEQWAESRPISDHLPPPNTSRKLE